MLKVIEFIFLLKPHLLDRHWYIVTMNRSWTKKVKNKKVISYLILKGFFSFRFPTFPTDINNSGEIDKKDFEIAIQVSAQSEKQKYNFFIHINL